MDLPFTRAEFLQIFADYNEAIWPAQFGAAILGLLTISMLFWRPTWADRFITAVLALFWSLMGIGYHWSLFTTINNAAYAFGALFLLAAVIFVVEGVIRNRIRFHLVPGIRGWAAGGLILYAFVIYPVVGLTLTHPFPQTPLFGVAPCPTTIFTLGLLLIAQHPKPLVIGGIPLLWSVIGGSAAVLLDVRLDLGLFAAGIAWVAGFLLRPEPTRNPQP
jgi:hypothetical protein